MMLQNKEELSFIADGNIRWHSRFGGPLGSLHKAKHPLSNQQRCFSGVYPGNRNMSTHKSLHSDAYCSFIPRNCQEKYYSQVLCQCAFILLRMGSSSSRQFITIIRYDFVKAGHSTAIQRKLSYVYECTVSLVCVPLPLT